MRETKTIKHDGYEVNITNKDIWSYEGVSASKIKLINFELYKAIQEKVEYFLANEEKIRAEERKKAADEALAEKRTMVMQLQKVFDEKLKAEADKHNINCGFNKLGEGLRNEVEFRFPNTYVQHDDKVWDGWHHKKTDRPWVMHDDEYRARRYKTFEAAAKKALGIEIDLKKVKLVRSEREQTEQEKDDLLVAHFSDKSWTYESNIEYGRRTRKQRTISKGAVKAEVDVRDSCIVILSYCVKKDNISVEELEEAAK